MKQLVISLAVNGRDPFELKQKGLIETLPVVIDSDIWILNKYAEGITPHSVTPYRFKYDLIVKGINAGYRQICWLDSSMRLLRNPFELLAQSEEGVVAFDNLGHPAWKYTSDRAAFNLRSYYQDIYEVKQVWGGAFLFDFDKPYAPKIIAAIFNQIKAGSFEDDGSEREGFVAARHDQTVLSYLLHFYKIPLLEYGVIAAKKDITEETYIQYGD